jgi:hypothetical protein
MFSVTGGRGDDEIDGIVVSIHIITAEHKRFRHFAVVQFMLAVRVLQQC